MTYMLKGTLVCDLCGTTVREDTWALNNEIIPKLGIVNYQLDGLDATLCKGCVTEMREAWNLYVCKLRKEGRLVGFQDYRKWATPHE